MRLLIFLILASIAWGATKEQATDSVSSVRISTVYPICSITDGQTGVPVDAVISWEMKGEEFDFGNDQDELYIEVAGAVIWSDSIYGALGDYYDTDAWTVTQTQAGDSLKLNRARDFAPFFEITVTFFRVGDDSIHYDTLTFRTVGTTTPFNVGVSRRSFTGSTSTGTATLSFAKPYGASIYGYGSDESVFTIAEPEAIYADERANRIVYYDLTTIPTGISKFWFYAVSSEADTSDTLSQSFRYTRVISGRPDGVISR